MKTGKLISKQIIINSLLIQYYISQQAGKDAGTLLFLHGWRSSSETWQPLLPYITQKYRIICLDLPGFGKSQVPLKPFSLSDYAQIVTAMIKKLEIREYSVIGHSFGGAVAITLAISQQPKIKKLILIDSSGIRPKAHKLQLLKMLAKMVKPVFRLKPLQSIRTAIYKNRGWDDYLATPYLQKTYIQIISEDLTDRLHLIKVPTLLIWGDKDTDTPLTHAHSIEKNIAKSKLKIIESAGHFSFLDQPKESSQYILDFIKA